VTASKDGTVHIASVSVAAVPLVFTGLVIFESVFSQLIADPDNAVLASSIAVLAAIKDCCNDYPGSICLHSVFRSILFAVVFIVHATMVPIFPLGIEHEF
jgi:hypothetical protein